MTEVIVIVHAAEPNDDAGVVIALCGESGFIRDDAEIIPESFDFAAPDSLYVDCEGCLAAAAHPKRLAAALKVPS